MPQRTRNLARGHAVRSCLELTQRHWDRLVDAESHRTMRHRKRHGNGHKRHPRRHQNVTNCPVRVWIGQKRHVKRHRNITIDPMDTFEVKYRGRALQFWRVRERVARA